MDILNLFDHKQYIPQVANWLYEEFINGIRAGISLEAVVNALGKRHRDTIPLTYIGVVNDECVGTASLVRNDLKSRDDLTPWLAALYVREADRGRGYARQLIDHVITSAKALGFQKLYLRTETAADYYRMLGWKKIYETIDEFDLFTEVFEKEIGDQEPSQ